jgi:hypothetical protein
MTKRSLLLFGIAVLCMPTAGQSRPMSVGGTILDIPDPPGFAVVTPQMATVLQARQSLRDPNGGQFIFYIPESEVPVALKGTLPSSGRSCTVEGDESVSISKYEFGATKREVRAESEEFYKEFAKEIPGFMANANDRVTKQFNVDYALSISNLVPLSPHEETDATLAWSTFSKVGARDATGHPVSLVMVVTSTIVYVRARLLYLTCAAEEDDLEWTRKVSKQWADSILAANPPDLQSSASESPTMANGIHGATVGKIIGIIMVGSIIVLRSWMRHRGEGKGGNESEEAQGTSH